MTDQNTATDRNATPATGVPLFVDPANDLSAKENASNDSWYVTCMFESEGKTLGFEWHQSNTPAEVQSEFLLTNATDNIWRPHTVAEPGSEAGASKSELSVYSSFGTLKGDRSRLTLNLKAEHGSVDVVLTPREQELYNGTTGLLPLGGQSSYEYGFPNMTVEGTFTIDGQTYPVRNATAWFDRQWGTSTVTDPVEIERLADAIANASWSWLGMAFGEDHRLALSFWDVYEGPGKRSTFATVLDEGGVLANVDAAVTYDRIWASSESGNKYPSDAHITAPQVGLDLRLKGLVDRPEFVYHSGNGHNGSQTPCRAVGRFGSIEIDQPVFLEMIGSVGG